MIGERLQIVGPVIPAASGMRGGSAIAGPIGGNNAHPDTPEGFLDPHEIESVPRRAVTIEHGWVTRRPAIGEREQPSIAQHHRCVEHLFLSVQTLLAKTRTPHAHGVPLLISRKTMRAHRFGGMNRPAAVKGAANPDGHARTESEALCWSHNSRRSWPGNCAACASAHCSKVRGECPVTS